MARKYRWGLEKFVTLFCGKTVSKTFNYGSLRGKLCAYFIVSVVEEVVKQ